MGLLDGDLADLLTGAFSGMYLPGRLVSITTTEDLHGKPTRAGEAMDILVQEDQVTHEMRRAEGYATEMVQLIILQRNAAGDVVPKPKPTDKILAKFTWWAADMVASDAAGSHWTMRATPTTPPPAP